jgi:hypothetical protein
MVYSEEWKEIDEKLKSIFRVVELMCDGYKLSIKLERCGQFKNAIAVYINGQIKREWYKECEESRRFFRKVSKSLYSQKEKDTFKKMSKKTRSYLEIDIDKQYSYYTPLWTSFNSLKRHLIKENKEISLVVKESEG